MGIAIIIPNIDFSGENLGQVHQSGTPVLTSITIEGDDVVYKSSQYNIVYNPEGTTLTGVTWEIVSGNEYASINNEGVLTVLSGAMGENVRIKAISTHDLTIESTLDIVVYDVSLEESGGVLFKDTLQTTIIPPSLATAELEIRYKIQAFAPSSGYGFMMGSRNGNTAGGSTDMFAVFMIGTSSEKMNGMFGATQTGNVVPAALNTDYVLKLNKDGLEVNGTSYAFTGSVGSVEPSRPIYIGKVNQPSMNSAAISGKALLNYIIIRDGEKIVNNLVPYYNGASDFGLFDTVDMVKYNVSAMTGAEFQDTY